MKTVGKILIGLLSLVCIFAFTGFIVNSHFYNKHYKNASVEQKTKNSLYNIKHILTNNSEILEEINIVVNRNKGDRDDTITASKTNKLWDDNYYMYIKIPYHELDGRIAKDANDFFHSYQHACGYDCKYYIQIEYIKGRSIRSSIAKDLVITGVSDEDIIMSSHEICDFNGDAISMDKKSSMESTKKGQTAILNLLPNIKRIALEIKPAMWN